MSTLIDTAVMVFGLTYYGFVAYVFLLRAHERSEAELKLKYVFSLQIIPFTALFLVNLLYFGEVSRSVTLLPLLVFLGYDFWYRALTERKPVHHPAKWPKELVIYIILLYAGSIGLNWYGFLVSKQYGRMLVIAFFVMVASYANYQIRYNKRKQTTGST